MLAKRGTLVQYCALLGLVVALAGCPSAPRQVALLVSPETLDFDLTKDSLTFTVRKSFSSPRLPAFTATVEEGEEWITVSPGEGTSTGPNDHFRFTVEIDRTKLRAGVNEGSITIASPGPIVPRTVTERARALIAADYTAEPDDPFAEFTEVQFTDLSGVAPEHASAIDSWLWDFGDGTTSTEQDPAHIYANPGTYDVSLTVTANGVSDTETKPVFIQVQPSARPTADFTFSPTSGILAGDPVTFTDMSVAGTAPISQWQWDFGDGNTSSEQNPVHSYTDGGFKTVTLVVISAHGASDPVSKTVEVGTTRPTVDFTASNTNPVFGDPVEFTNLSTPGTAPIDRYVWDFGDGVFSEEVNPVHVYAPKDDQRVFTVRLTAYSRHGNSTAEKVNYITVQTFAPTADFTASPLEVYAENPVEFTDLSEDGTAAIKEWLWDFGDGGSSTEQHPTYSYANPGTYAVSLTVTSAHGSDTAQKAGYITVLPRRPPDADFTYFPASPYELDEVQFTDTSEPHSSPIESWLWTFGDGGSSTEQHPVHVYQAPGTYTVSLTATSSDGPDTEQKTIEVRPNVDPTADFTAEPLRPVMGDEVQFTDTSDPGTAPLSEWLWAFGDGQTSTEQHPVHVYNRAGKTSVSLTATSRHGTHTVTKPNYISVLPLINFTAEPTSAAVGKPVRFTDMTGVGGGSPVVRWLWDFGDGLQSEEQHPVHTYGRAGNFNVSLTVELADGIVHTVTKDGTAHEEPTDGYITAEIALPKPNFEASNWNPLFFEQVSFTDSSDPGSAPIIKWEWDFGDGSPVSNAQHPTHVYQPQAAQTFTVTLRVWNSYMDPNGPGQEVSKPIMVGESEPVAQFTQDKTVITIGDTVTFRSTSYVEGSGRITGHRWLVWPDGTPMPAQEWNHGRSNSATYVAGPDRSYHQYPFQKAGRYNVALRVYSDVLVNPGNPDDPTSSPDFESDLLVKLNAVEVRERSALDTFVRTPGQDPNYTYQLLNKQSGNGLTTYTLRMVSQAWSVYQPSAPSPAVWEHDMIVIQPTSPANNTALLYLDSGKEMNPGGTPVVEVMKEFAATTGSVVAVLQNVPNQPIAYPHLGNEALFDDRLLAASFDAFVQFANTPVGPETTPSIPNALALYPMVKSAIRGMDTVQRLLADPSESGVFPPIIVNGFVVAGGSPDGWTLGWVTWLTGATDPRVKGIVPFSFDALNISEQFFHQFETRGDFPETWISYTEPYPTGFNLTNYLMPDPSTPLRSALSAKHWLRKLQQVHLLILEDLRDDSFSPPVLDNEADHLQALRDFLDVDDSPYELLDALPGGEARNLALTMRDELDVLLENMPEERPQVRQAVIHFSGNTGTQFTSNGLLDGGTLGELGAALLRLHYQRLKSNPGPWLQYMIDPIYYSDPYALAYQYYSEFGERLRMPKYILNSPADNFSSPDANGVYYHWVNHPKLLRLVAGDSELEERTLGGFAARMLEVVPWYNRVVAGDVVPRLEWQHLSDELLHVNAGHASLQGATWKLWTAESETGEFSYDPVFNPDAPDWTSVSLVPQNGTIVVQIEPTVDTYIAYFVEATLPDGVIATTECRVVPPYQSPFE